MRLKDPVVDTLCKIGYYDQSRAYRGASREFGTGLGIRCHIETREILYGLSLRGNEWEGYTEMILLAWELNIDHGSTYTPAPLVPITLVMCASALIPGGVWPRVASAGFHQDV